MDAKDLIKHCLVVDPKERYTVAQALDHPWFGILDDEKQHISADLVSRIRQYKQGTILRKWVLHILVKLLTDEDTKQIKEDFDVIDQDKTGFLCYKEMKSALKNSQTQLKNSEINSIIRELDFNSDGQVTYSEFLVATIDIEECVS